MSASTAGRAAGLAILTGVEHPTWCDPAYCWSFHDGTVIHNSRPRVAWQDLDDAGRIELFLTQTDDPEVVGTRPHIEMRAVSEVRGIINGESVLELAEATNLATEIQAMVDLAGGAATS